MTGKSQDKMLPRAVARMTTKGRANLPRKMLVELGWMPGDSLEFARDGAAQIVVRHLRAVDRSA